MTKASHSAAVDTERLPPLGAHIGFEPPLQAAAEREATCVQLFLADPQGWRAPPPRDDAEELRAASIPLFVHAPYTINLAAANNRVRIPSRSLLAATCRAAAAIGAAGVIVHGGHRGAGEDLSEGIERWRKALQQLESPVPVLLENTAGGQWAMARSLDSLAQLWEVIGQFGTGLCLDTCHAHASGEGLEDIVDRVKAITGRIDLVHLNDSRDPAGSGRDRHARPDQGTIGFDELAWIVAQAGAPAVYETPATAEEHRMDLTSLRLRLGTEHGRPVGTERTGARMGQQSLLPAEE